MRKVAKYYIWISIIILESVSFGITDYGKRSLSSKKKTVKFRILKRMDSKLISMKVKKKKGKGKRLNLINKISYYYDNRS
jgi:hypothetical protein